MSFKPVKCAHCEWVDKERLYRSHLEIEHRDVAIEVLKKISCPDCGHKMTDTDERLSCLNCNKKHAKYAFRIMEAYKEYK